MSNDSIRGLGPRKEAPKLNPKADFASAKLSPQEGFVLSRVDGRTSIEQICLLSGLGEEATIAILQKLKAMLLIVTSAPMSELPPDVAPPSAARAATLGKAGGPAVGSGQAAEGAGGRDDEPSRGAPGRGKGAEAPAARGCQGEGAMATDAVRPVPPLADHEIDPAELADGRDLPEETKRRILAFYKRLPQLDFFDRLEIDPSADRQAIRRAYFRLSKEFHPDRYYGKDLGGYRQRLSDVFKALSEAFATLSDDNRRQAYVLELRDRAAARAQGGRPHPRGRSSER